MTEGARELRWPCAKCGRTDSLYQALKTDVVVCLSCGYEEPTELASRRRFNDGPKLVLEG